VGFNTVGEGEIDSETVRDSVVAVESRAAALAPPPAGAIEPRRAIERGVIDEHHVVVEIGELAAGCAQGRSDDSQITLYKSVGVAVQDAAAAALILALARTRDVGVHVDI
jgi:ornithine cyclodeaminase